MAEFSTTAGIAGDLTLAIHRGNIRPGEQLPSRHQIMQAYNVAAITATAAVNKVVAAGLARSIQGRGTYALDLRRLHLQRPMVLEVLAAMDACRTLAGIEFGAGGPQLEIGGELDWSDPHADPERASPPRIVDMAALAEMDRNLLWWMSEAFAGAARRIVGYGLHEADRHLIAAARSILTAGGRRPDGQAAIAQLGGQESEEEDYARRLWPQRRNAAADNDQGTPSPF